jgi:hypothetical protein
MSQNQKNPWFSIYLEKNQINCHKSPVHSLPVILVWKPLVPKGFWNKQEQRFFDSEIIKKAETSRSL